MLLKVPGITIQFIGCELNNSESPEKLGPHNSLVYFGFPCKCDYQGFRFLELRTSHGLYTVEIVSNYLGIRQL